MASTETQLEPLTISDVSENAPSLPPVDRGTAAWSFIAASFVAEALIWGFPFSFGVFQEYYSSNAPFTSQPNIAAIGTSASGIMYLITPILMSIMGRYPITARYFCAIGFGIVILALVAASFAQTVTQLILTQGVMYAVGGGMANSPVMLFIDEWFVKRKGLAVGIVWAGNGVAGIILPLILNAGMQKYGFRMMLRGYAVFFAMCAVPIVLYVRPRLPVNRHTGPKRINLDFLRHQTFWWLQMGSMIEGLGYFLPGIYLPAFANSIGLSRLTGSLALSMLNAAAIVGLIVMGSFCDRWNGETVMMISAAGSTLAVFLLWGFTTSTPLLIVFALLYGFFAGGFASTWSGAIKRVVREHPTEQGFLFGLFCGGRGVGNLVAGPISEVLLGARRSYIGMGGANAYGGEYAGMIIYTGITGIFGALGWFGLGPPRRLVKSLLRQ